MPPPPESEPPPPLGYSADGDLPGSGEPGDDLELRISTLGARLRASLEECLRGVPDAPRRPQLLADRIGVEKVLTSRLLRALDSHDPIAVVRHCPGPPPLRRVIEGARRAGAPATALDAAAAAVDDFEHLLRVEIGDRGYLDTILAGWLPEARGEFELRSKQTASRALAQLLGASAELLFSTVLVHPSADGEHLDLVWLIGVYGLRRLRPGAAVRFTTRRVAGGDRPRSPLTLEGTAAEALELEGLRLDQFCQAPPAPLAVQAVGEVMHYHLAGRGFGPRSAVDLVLAEVNRAEIPAAVPAGSGRRGYFFAEVTPPTRLLVFDVLVHEQAYPGREPELGLYDTSFEGVADVNRRERDVSRLPLHEKVQPLGRGLDSFASSEVPNHGPLLRHVFARTGFDAQHFRGYRVRIDYPVYGSQVTLSFAAPERSPAP
jgi:hypothetical protein